MILILTDSLNKTRSCQSTLNVVTGVGVQEKVKIFGDSSQTFSGNEVVQITHTY